MNLKTPGTSFRYSFLYSRAIQTQKSHNNYNETYRNNCRCIYRAPAQV